MDETLYNNNFISKYKINIEITLFKSVKQITWTMFFLSLIKTESNTLKRTFT